jgi:hypothetical protein
MDGWVDGWVGGCMDGCVGGWVGGRVDGWMHGWMDGTINKWTKDEERNKNSEENHVSTNGTLLSDDDFKKLISIYPEVIFLQKKTCNEIKALREFSDFLPITVIFAIDSDDKTFVVSTANSSSQFLQSLSWKKERYRGHKLIFRQ